MGQEQEEELQKESKMSKQQPLYVGWLQWDRQTAEGKLGSKDVEELKRS